jgi:integrase
MVNCYTMSRRRTGKRIESHHIETITRADETFATAVARVCTALRANGMVTADERLSRLERFAVPALGHLMVTEVTSGHISAVLEATAKVGLSGQTVRHLQVDLGVIFRELMRDQVLTVNPATADRVRIPKIAKDKRKRALLTDAEFLRFIQCRHVRYQLRVMAVASRAHGGLRTSDLHAWVWEDFDLKGWESAMAPRPKTEHHDGEERPRERLELAQLTVDWMKPWWISQGRPRTGLVFPEQKHSYARDLRRARLLAGIDRHELHHDTPTSRCVDFHSFRRAFVTAVAAAGLNAQTAMRLSGHRSIATHQRYNLPVVIPIPEAAVPQAAEPTDSWDSALERFAG